MAEPVVNLDAWTRQHVAELLCVAAGEIDDETNLLEDGMDSIRLAHLAQRFRSAGFDVDLVDLADAPTIAAWVDLLTEVS